MNIPKETVFYWLGETFPAGRIPELDDISVACLSIRTCNIMYDADQKIVKITYDGDHASVVVPVLHHIASKALLEITTSSRVHLPLPRNCEPLRLASVKTNQAKTEAQTAPHTFVESTGNA